MYFSLLFRPLGYNTSEVFTTTFRSMIYHCIITSGGGTKYDGGNWVRKETPKRVVWSRITAGQTYGGDFDNLIINKEKRSQHAIRDWSDGTYTIYPNQAGTPFYFYPIEVGA